MNKELDKAFQKFMLPMLEKILKIIERIERKVNECRACQGEGSRRFMNADHLCAQCNGTGVMRHE